MLKNNWSIDNYQYIIKWVDTPYFDFNYAKGPVGYQRYDSIFLSQLPHVIKEIKSNILSRKAVISYFKWENDISCIISIQFRVRDNKIFLHANFRSQHVRYGKPTDERYLCWCMSKFLEELPHLSTFDKIITVHVADFHDYDDITLPSEKDIREAQEIIKLGKMIHYEKLKVVLPKIEDRLKEIFKGTIIKDFYVSIENDTIEVFSIDPRYDEDYDGEFDAQMSRLSEEFGIQFHFEPGNCGK